MRWPRAARARPVPRTAGTNGGATQDVRRGDRDQATCCRATCRNDVYGLRIGVDTTGYSTYTSGGTTQKELIYSPGGDDAWRFTQFGPLAIAVNGVDAPQAFDLSVGTRWAALGGTPPVAAFVTTVRDFVLMGKIATLPQRVQWSGINNATLWGSVPANQADIQDLPDGGNITGLVGGEYALIFQETSVRRMTYEGPPIIFRIDKIANDIGASVPGSVASLIDMAFFVHKSGFYMVQGGQTITPIGRGKIDRTFWAEFDETNQFRTSAAIDPVRGLYIFAYPANGNGGVPNRLLIYNWRTQKWAHAQVTCELVFGGVSQQSYTLEQLDPFGALDALPYSLDSSFWTGTVSLLLFAFDTSHKSGLSGATLGSRRWRTAEFNPRKRRSVGDPRRRADRRRLPHDKDRRERDATGALLPMAPRSGSPAGLAPVYQSGRCFRVRARMPRRRPGRTCRASTISTSAPAGEHEPARARPDRRHRSITERSTS
jgi:hypothetical protein